MNNNYNEEIFFKVFKNQYLLNHIFKCQNNDNWVSTNSVEGFRFNNRKKFQDLTNLEWFTNNFQYKLLNYKLKCGDNIKLDYNGLKSLFNSKGPFEKYKIRDETSFRVYYCSRLKEYYRDGDENIFKNQFIPNIIKESNERKETIQLILKLYSKELKEFNMISILISPERIFESTFKPNLELLSIFTSSPYNFKIEKPFFHQFINSVHNKYRDMVIDFVSDNQHIYQSSDNSKILLDLYEYLSIKSINTQIKLYNSGLIILNKKRTTIDVDSIMNGDNISGCIQNLYQQYFEYHKLKTSKIQKLLELYQIYLVKFKQVIHGLPVKFDSQVLRYSLSYSSADGLKYMMDSQFKMEDLKEPIVKIKGGTNITNEFISIYTSDRIYPRYRSKFVDISICKFINSMVLNNDISGYKEAVNSFSFNHNLFKSNKLPKSLWSNIKSLSLVVPVAIKDEETINWLAENYQTIQDIYQKDVLELPTFKYQTVELLKYLNDQFRSTSIELESKSQLSASASASASVSVSETESASPVLKFLTNGPIHSLAFSIAIENCDLDSLKYLNENYNDQITEFNKTKKRNISHQDKLIRKSIITTISIYNYLDTIIKKEKKIKFKSTSSLMKLLEYLNSTNYKLFSSTLFKEFISCIADSSEYIDFSKLNINFNLFPQETLELYIESITDIKSPNTIQLILNNNSFSNSFMLDSNFISLSQYWKSKSKDRFECTFYYFYHGYSSDGDHFPMLQSCLYYLGTQGERFHCTSGELPSEIIQIIEMVLNQFRSYTINNGDNSNQYLSNELSNLFQDILNHLFKRLIRSHTVTIDQIRYIRQLINKSWSESISNIEMTSKLNLNHQFQFQHSLYHSYYYLAAKSLKTIKLILSWSSTYYMNQSTSFDLDSVNYEDEESFDTFKSSTQNILKFFDTNYFTYEFIFNSTTTDVMDALIQKLLHEPMAENKFESNFNYSEYIQRVLKVLMNTKEIDLFFKQLEIIQTQIDNQDFEFRGIQTNVNHVVSEEQDKENGIVCTINEFYKDLKAINSRFIYFDIEIIEDALSNLDFNSFFKFCKFGSYFPIEWISIEDQLNQPTSGQNLNLLKDIITYFNNKS